MLIKKWNKKEYETYIKYLKSLSDSKYREFHKSLTETKYEIIGIRVPMMRHLAKEKLKTDLRIQPDAVSFYIYGNLEKRINTSEVADENIGAIYSNEVCISDCLLYMSYIVNK